MHPTPQNNLMNKVTMISETNWVANGGNGVFARTFNSGANWYFHFTAGKVNSATLATAGTTDNWFFDANTGIVVGDQGYIGRTTNGGVTFDTQELVYLLQIQEIMRSGLLMQIQVILGEDLRMVLLPEFLKQQMPV